MIDYTLAQIAYDAYVTAVGGKSYRGEKLPLFEEIPDKIKDGWWEAAKAVERETLAQNKAGV